MLQCVMVTKQYSSWLKGSDNAQNTTETGNF